MATLADALEVLLRHSGIPEENEDRDVVQAVIDHQRNAVTAVTKAATKAAKEGDK